MNRVLAVLICSSVLLLSSISRAQVAPDSLDWNKDVVEQILQGIAARKPLRSVPGHAQAGQPVQTAPPGALSGMASMSCSGAVVRFSSDPNEQAILLSNGHCYDIMQPNTYVFMHPVQKSLLLYTRDNQKRPYKADMIIYATMTGTDVSLMRLNATYAQLEAAGIDSYEISPAAAAPGDAIELVSGFFASVQQCSVQKIIYQIHEASWQWNDSYKLQGCQAEHGMSGSPLISPATGKIVGIINTGNDSGERCTFDNPCEIDQAGNVIVDQGSAYGQHVEQIVTCLDSQGHFDVNTPGCGLFRNAPATFNPNPQGWM